MELKIARQHFVVTGCSSGFGKAITDTLCAEGASVTGIARTRENLDRMKKQWGDRFTSLQGDLLDEETPDRLDVLLGEKNLHGLVLNAGGPPAGKAVETSVSDWDNAYRLVFRWKANLALRLLPRFQKAGYGRILFIESQSTKQPIPSLALSNAMRCAVTGFAKSLSGDVAASGVTVNLLAPGAHATPAIERVIAYRAGNTGESPEEARKAMEAAIPAGRFGKAEELASMAAWLLSAHAGYVTGQTLSHDGGNVRGLFG